jgi:hypothetical protein
MRIKFWHRNFFAAVLFTLLALGPRALAQETPDMLKQALDLVHQVENPSGQLTDAQRVNLLTQAITLAQKAPNHRLKGHRVLAIEAIRGAIGAVQGGDTTHQASTYLHTADTELETSISLSQGSDSAPPPNSPAPSPATPANGVPASTEASWMASQH